MIRRTSCARGRARLERQPPRGAGWRTVTFAAAALLGAPQAAALPRRSAEPPAPAGVGRVGPAARTTPTAPAGEPGSATPLERAPRATNPARLKAPLPRRPRSAEEAAALTDQEALLERYQAAHAAHADTLAHLLIVDGIAAEDAIARAYDAEIATRRAQARKLRAQAVERYAAFLELHPNDPSWTPEILFRLAELQFEGASERFAEQEGAYEEALIAHQERIAADGEAAAGPAPLAPVAEYGPAIALYRDVVTRFPNYGFGDAALYMMGTLLGEQDDLDGSRQAFLALACRSRYAPPEQGGANVIPSASFRAGDYGGCTPYRADSRYVIEAWLRVGELHYDLDELEPALEAYAQAAADPTSELYDEALIRIAWTQYLRRDFTAAAKTFDDFIQLADTRIAAGDREGAVLLRGDAVRYLAKTYLEEDWDGDGRTDRAVGLARLDRDYKERTEPHVPEVYAALGDLLAIETDYGQAIRIWTATLRRWPLAPAAPEIQLKVLQAYDMLQDPTNSRSARDALATNYLRGTPWYEANSEDPDAIERAQKLAEDALVATAVDYHARAQAMRAAGESGYEAAYAIAAKAYRAYLERFPDTPSSYEYRYNFADSLYFSGQPREAAEQYALVRDSNLDNRLQVDAATGAFSALEQVVEAERRAGTIAWPDLPKLAPGATAPTEPMEPMELPPLALALQAAYDRYIAIEPDGEGAATLLYTSGEIDQRFRRFDAAEPKFIAVLDRHCDENVAINAGKAIIDAHVVRGDLKGTQEWSERLIEYGCGEGDAGTEFAGELRTIKNAVRFQEANLLYEAGEYEAAADRYIALVDGAPDDANADRALNNAAVAYEKIGRFASASQTYRRIFTEYPDSSFADDALLRTGFNHLNFFEFDEAVKTYLILAQDERYKDSEFRETALKNAADLLDAQQQYTASADLYRQYAAKTEDPAKAAEALFRAAQVTEKTGDVKATIKSYVAFLARFAGDAAQGERTVEAHLRIGQAHASRKDRKQAEQSYRDAVAIFAARGLQPGTEAANIPAEAQFLLAEYAMGDYLQVKLKSTGKKLEAETEQLLDTMLAASDAYVKVVEYRSVDWALASVYRTAFAFESTAIKFREAPVPSSLREFSEPWFAYKDLVEAAAVRFEEKAISFYEKTLEQAKAYGVANDWTRAAIERLNVYKPEEYPLLRRPALDLQLEDTR